MKRQTLLPCPAAAAAAASPPDQNALVDVRVERREAGVEDAVQDGPGAAADGRLPVVAQGQRQLRQEEVLVHRLGPVRVLLPEVRDEVRHQRAQPVDGRGARGAGAARGERQVRGAHRADEPLVAVHLDQPPPPLPAAPGVVLQRGVGRGEVEFQQVVEDAIQVRVVEQRPRAGPALLEEPEHGPVPDEAGGLATQRPAEASARVAPPSL